MKRLNITIFYNIDSNKDTKIVFKCPHSNKEKELSRTDVEDLDVMDEISKKEMSFWVRSPRLLDLNFGFQIKVTDKMYNQIFYNRDDYNDEETKKDLNKIFEILNMHINIGYSIPEFRMEYVKDIDYDGSMDGCEYCLYKNKNNYCEMNNVINPDKKKCNYYKFKKINS